jgi:hypothetical protein
MPLGWTSKDDKGGPTAALFFSGIVCCNDVHQKELHKL